VAAGATHRGNTHAGAERNASRNGKGSQRRQQILEEATSLFAGHGYDGASIRVIARACGITEAAIYRHFDNKIHLYEEVIRAKAAEHDIAGQLAVAAEQGSVEDVLRAVAEHILDLARRDQELMRLMFNSRLGEGSVADVLFSEIRLPYIRFVADELSRRLAAGEIREVDPLITARCFVGMVMDCALNFGVWEKLTDVEFQAGDVVCNNVPIFARGLEATADR
jgi:AcrR family transcriptional regulator